MRDIISVQELTKNDVLSIFERTEAYLSGKRDNILSGKIVGLAFFEPSTRTSNSFESAAKRLGGETVGFRSEEGTSLVKGETFSDTIRMMESYADILVIRHKFEGAAKHAARISKVPVINAGDGKNEHPTQTILDLFSIRKLKGDISSLKVGVMGDLRYGRAVNSLLFGFNIFNPKRVYLIGPKQLSLRQEVRDRLNFGVEETEDPYSIAEELDVLYVTRIQKERFPDEEDYYKLKGSYRVDLKLVNRMKPEAIILHPLPRVDEIDRRVDSMRQAKYFFQASLGVFVRMGIFSWVMENGQ